MACRPRRQSCCWSSFVRSFARSLVRSFVVVGRLDSSSSPRMRLVLVDGIAAAAGNLLETCCKLFTMQTYRLSFGWQRYQCLSWPCCRECPFLMATSGHNMALYADEKLCVVVSARLQCNTPTIARSTLRKDKYLNDGKILHHRAAFAKGAAKQLSSGIVRHVLAPNIATT